MQRPANYKTKQGEVIFAYLQSVKDIFVTVPQIEDYLKTERVAISRPTIYRQLEKFVNDGKVSKHTFDGTSVASFKYNDPDGYGQELCRLKCEVCDTVYNLDCDEVEHISQHISETHFFQVNDRKIVFYGKCKKCLQE